MQQRAAAALAGLSHHEQVRKVALLPRPFSIDKGEMTPSLKLRRAIIQQNHAVVARYGASVERAQPWGQSCLLARRLVEAGVSFVGIGRGGWDDHDDG